VPEVAIEILSSIEEVEDIIEPILFVHSHILGIWNFDEARTSSGVFENNCIISFVIPQ
jgi:hypothetical protein